jgi:hypothetical protein
VEVWVEARTTVVVVSTVNKYSGGTGQYVFDTTALLISIDLQRSVIFLFHKKEI